MPYDASKDRYSLPSDNGGCVGRADVISIGGAAPSTSDTTDFSVYYTSLYVGVSGDITCVPVRNTFYKTDVFVSGNTATIYLPDGSANPITNAKIGALAGPYATWEVFQGDAAADDKAGFTQAWAT